MRKFLTIIASVSLFLAPIQFLNAAIIKAGANCSKMGISQVINGYKFTCIKSGKKLIWDKGIVYKKLPPVVSNGTTTTSKTNSNTTLSTPTTPSMPNLPKPGDPCINTSPIGLKVSDGTLYCVIVSDGSFKFIEFFNDDPKISNPPSPSPLSDCQAPDLRKNIPPEASSYAIAHDSTFLKSVTMKHIGTFNIVVEPIDFSDAVGVDSPKSLYGNDFESLANWFETYSNGKLKVNVKFHDAWLRASKPSASYNAGGIQGAGQDSHIQKGFVQEFVNLSSDKNDYLQADLAVFVYPKSATSIIGWLDAWDMSVQVNSQESRFAILSTFADAGKYEPYYEWIAHETLHRMGLAMHFPANPPGWGVEWGRYTYSEGLLPWNQMILDWLSQDQYYCVLAKNISNAKITLIPQESNKSGMRTVFIRVSESEVLMVVSYRKGTWSYKAPDSFYGTMVALIDTSKQNDWSSEETANSDENFDGIKHQRVGVWLHPKNNVEDDMSWTNEHTGEWGALMYLGDTISYKGINIKLVDSNNFDTVEISKD